MEPNQMPPAHHQMNNKAIVMAVILFILIVAGMFVFAYLKKSESLTVVKEPITEEPTSSRTQRFSYLDRVNGTHYYIDGVHTVLGEILMPTPCDLLEADAIIAESNPEQITLEFSVINNADSCAAVMTSARFKVEAQASEGATFRARFLGEPIELNLTPAPAGETPDEFEIFIKG